MYTALHEAFGGETQVVCAYLGDTTCADQVQLCVLRHEAGERVTVHRVRWCPPWKPAGMDLYLREPQWNSVPVEIVLDRRARLHPTARAARVTRYREAVRFPCEGALPGGIEETLWYDVPAALALGACVMAGGEQ